ncbi:MAG: hypothetical protein ACLSAP_08390 [Oscillospiraceae bacterium]
MEKSRKWVILIAMAVFVLSLVAAGAAAGQAGRWAAGRDARARYSGASSSSSLYTPADDAPVVLRLHPARIWPDFFSVLF